MTFVQTLLPRFNRPQAGTFHPGLHPHLPIRQIGVIWVSPKDYVERFWKAVYAREPKEDVDER